MSDRIVGALLFVLAIAYGVQARTFTSGFMGDPVGPGGFPVLLAVLLLGSSAYLIVRPDPGADWPRGRALAQQAFTVAVLIGYAFALQPFGFLPSSFVALTLVGAQFDVRYHHAALMGAATTAVLLVLFDWVLGLALPMGTLYGG